jgi:hypothetical protein
LSAARASVITLQGEAGGWDLVGRGAAGDGTLVC